MARYLPVRPPAGGPSAKAIGSGYGAGDYLCLDRLIRVLRSGGRRDMDVDDAAAWSSMVDLSHELSARNRSRPIDFPDFTRGGWRTTPPRQGTA